MAGCYRTLALRPISQGEETAKLNRHFVERTRYMASSVTEPSFADVAVARAHFARRLQLETDCSDVHESMKQGADFILIDVRGPALFAAGHVPGAINIPHRAITAERMAEYPQDTLCVVYCAGPHCNGAHKAAIRLTGLGYRLKEMIGGITGWRNEGFSLEATNVAA
jgi:rhodanese-related sulfurtransferase